MNVRVLQIYIVYGITVWLGLTSYTQTPAAFGAREIGMANSESTYSSVWSVNLNPAGIINTETPSIGFSYFNQFQLKELSTKDIAAVIPTNTGGFGANYAYFGTSTYNLQNISIGYAHKLGEKFYAGITTLYHSINLPNEYETTHAISGNIGVIMLPIAQLRIGVNLNNISNSKYANYIQESPDMFFRTGISWKAENFLISGSIILSKDRSPTTSIGTEISFIKELDIRLGVSSADHTNFTFGLGYGKSHWQTDLAFCRHPNLGYSSAISVEFYFGKNKR